MIDLRLLLLLILSLKTCTVCGGAKCLDDFYPNKLGVMGRAARCKQCDSRVKKNHHRMKKLRAIEDEAEIFEPMRRRA